MALPDLPSTGAQHGCPFPFVSIDPAVPLTIEPTEPAPVPADVQGRTIFKVALPPGQPDTEAWWLSDHAAAREVYLRDDLFLRATADGILPFLNLAPLIATQDGQHLRDLRSLVIKAFNAPNMRRFRPSVESLADSCLDNLTAAGEPADLVAHLAWPLSLNAVAEVLGVPAEGRDQFHTWGDMLLSTGPNRAAENAQAMTEMTAYAGRLMAAQAGKPDGGMLAYAVAKGTDLGIDPAESAMLVASLAVAGWETTAAAIAASVHKLLTTHDPAGVSLYHQLCARPELIPTAVEELLRVIPNSWFDTGQPRRAAVDTELAGVQIKAGDVILVAHDIANRDPRVFADPDRLDLARADNPHLSFGHGAHYCLGANLARLELNVALEQLTARLPALRLTVDAGDVEWNRATPIRRPLKVPVAWSSPNA
ncbi:cytochrome P450 [Spirillospora sp. NPDC029432]|uniref:cytochrome P450 n=1 Tax=Spirillospora sp. NPDC029432 TaxID=3154599 RepID=UPI003456DB29